MTAEGEQVKSVGRTAAILFAVGAFVLGALLAAGVSHLVADGGSSTATKTVTITRSVQIPAISMAPVAPVGVPETNTGSVAVDQPVVDGNLQFVVNGVRRAPSIPDNYNPVAPQNGEFFIVDATVTNVGTQQARYGAQYQKLIVDGQMYPFADMATYKETDQQITVNLNPGIRISTVVVFDIPVGVQPDRLEVHEDDRSTGGYVTLR